MTLHIGLIGCGAIGSKVITAVLDGTIPNARLTGIHTRTSERAHSLLDTIDPPYSIPLAQSARSLTDDADLVVEAASQRVIATEAIPILQTGTDLLALSVGAFRDPALLGRVRTTAETTNSRVYVPSGAIAGLDGIAGLSLDGIDDVSLTGYRPPPMLTPYVDDPIKLAGRDSGAVIFDGTARDAAEAFPAHMNIAIALTLVAHVDPDDVRVKLVLDHDAPRSRYVVSANGTGGRVIAEVENVTTPTGPEATQLVIQSTIAKLRRLSDVIVVGT